MHERVHVFGIRHHGPGSAASVLAALDELDPAAVLVEAPIDTQDLLPLAAAPGMRTPVALLVHDKKDASRALFHPFAEYSPEWQAIGWALRRERPLRAIDLAAGVELTEERWQERSERPRDGGQLQRDPLSALATASGHSDGEAWWNALVEQGVQGAPVFGAITAAMAALREQPGAALDADDPEQRHELQREAHMRDQIRKALDEFDGELAVIVGAWHAPALGGDHTRSADRALLRGLRPTKVEVTWVPWTDARLAQASGYGAGVVSPGWYRHLWSCFSEQPPADGLRSAVRWQSLTTRLLRDEGLPAATASTIEAARLATCLAALRGHPVPGLAEMQDASLAALCHGETAPLRVIVQRLVVGERIGEIDDSVPQMALAADLARQQKRVRLKPEALEKQIAVDLRTDAGLAKSTLLHRLRLIDVPWGSLVDASAGRGTFREVWELCWRPELSIQLAEALQWGTTIEQASAQAAVSKARQATRVVEIAELVEACLLAGLEQAAALVIARLQAAAATSSDISSLMAAATPMASILRYGTARDLPTHALVELVDSIVTEVVAGLPHACRSLDDDASAAMRRQLVAFDDAISTLDGDHHRAAWQRVVGAVADDAQTMPLLAGWATRSLYERNVRPPEHAAAAMSRALSPSVPVRAAGDWLSGFLGDAAHVLLHDRELLAVIDAWLAQPDDEDFVELLPVLRRAFADFDATERRRLMQATLAPRSARHASIDDGDDLPAAYVASLPLLHRILGLEGS